MAYPKLSKALEIYNQSMQRLEVLPKRHPIELDRLHSLAVAFISARLAADIPGLNTEKAYVLGLLHDYGEVISRTDSALFHGTSGYDEMLKMGFDDCARICLTHTFLSADFEVADYAYPQKEMLRAKELMQKVTMDDYDRVVQMGDLLVNGYTPVTIEQRLDFIREKYHISEAAYEQKLLEANKFKTLLDEKCGIDIYTLLGINNEYEC